MTESSGLPPDQEAVRRLLADARHTAPPPPEVVARLDDTLASLVSERSAGSTAGSTAEGTAEGNVAHDDRSPSRVVDLGSRRRRIAGIGLLAAASVVVAGVAIGQALPRGGSDDAAESSAGAAQSDTSLAESGEAGGSGADSSTGSGSDQGGDPGASEPAPESAKSSQATPYAGMPRLSSAAADLEDQVLALRDAGATRRQQLATLDALRGCDVPRPGRAAALVAADVDGRPGVVVFRRPLGDAQGVELYVCGDPAPARTITLPAP